MQGPAGAAKGKVPEHWRDRMHARQKYWSLSHGFQFGRKLADWGKGNAHQQDQETADRASAAAAGDYEEDQEVQEAIRRSLCEGSMGTAPCLQQNWQEYTVQ